MRSSKDIELLSRRNGRIEDMDGVIETRLNQLVNPMVTEAQNKFTYHLVLEMSVSACS